MLERAIKHNVTAAKNAVAMTDRHRRILRVALHIFLGTSDSTRVVRPFHKVAFQIMISFNNQASDARTHDVRTLPPEDDLLVSISGHRHLTRLRQDDIGLLFQRKSQALDNVFRRVCAINGLSQIGLRQRRRIYKCRILWCVRILA